MLRRWRQRRRLSQLDLSLAADVSTRHLSFLETGRATPSRDMVLHLADHLDVPLRERNALLLAAGYAPVYAESGLDGPDMAPTMAALRGVLAGHEPYPALLVDRRWNLVDLNDSAAGFLTAGISAELLEPPVNVLRASLHPDGLAKRIVNLREWHAHLLHRLRREADLLGVPELDDLYEELSGYPYGGADGLDPGTPRVAVPLRIRHGDGELTFLSLVSTFGTPVDVTLDELVLETFLPADDATVRAMNDR